MHQSSGASRLTALRRAQEQAGLQRALSFGGSRSDDDLTMERGNALLFPVAIKMLAIAFLSFLAGWAVCSLVSSSSHNKIEKRKVELLEMQAEFMKQEFQGTIPAGSFLVQFQDSDLGDLMSGKAGKTERTFPGFREAPAAAYEGCVDEELVSILDDSGELIVSGSLGSLKTFVLRVPSAWKTERDSPPEENGGKYHREISRTHPGILGPTLSEFLQFRDGGPPAYFVEDPGVYGDSDVLALGNTKTTSTAHLAF